MLDKTELKAGKLYQVQGKGNDIFKTGEKVLFETRDDHSFIFKQGSIEIVINEAGIEKFLSSMDFRQMD